jgi:hypothetical protein
MVKDIVRMSLYFCVAFLIAGLLINFGPTLPRF